MQNKRFLLLNGSVRKKGTSYSFARTMKKLIEDMGGTAEISHVIDYFDEEKEIHEFESLMQEVDFLAMIAPLYADALPYYDLWFLEKVADTCSQVLEGKGFFAIGQCGFPDITRIDPILDACQIFAQEMKMEWLGGLAYGGGAMLDGAFLEELGEKGEKITQGFKLALQDIFSGKAISDSSQELITVKIPKILYWPLVVFLNHSIRKKARESGNPDYKRKVYLE